MYKIIMLIIAVSFIFSNAKAERVEQGISEKGTNCFLEGLCRVYYYTEAKISLNSRSSEGGPYNLRIYRKGNRIKKIAYIDKIGNIVLDNTKICGLSCEILYARNFIDGVAYIKFVNFTLMFPNLQNPLMFNDEYKEEWVDGKYPIKSGFIDKNGKILFLIDAGIDSEVEEVRDFLNGVAAIRVRGRGWGFIDKTGRMVIEPQFGLGE